MSPQVQRYARDGAFGALLLFALTVIYAADQLQPAPRVSVATPTKESGDPSTEVAPVTPPRTSSLLNPGPPPLISPQPRSEKQPETQPHPRQPDPQVDPQPKIALVDPPPKPKPILLPSIPKLDDFGNLVGTDLGLAKEGEFEGKRILAWSNYYEIRDSVFPADNPLWEALKNKGFEIRTEYGSFDPDWLEETDQLWVVAGNRDSLRDEDYEAIIDFARSGKGLYVLADNAPYLAEADQFAQRMYKTNVTGDYQGERIIAVCGAGITGDDYRALQPQIENTLRIEQRPAFGLPGLGAPPSVINRATHYVDPHPLLTDVNFIYEGITISHLDPCDELQPVMMSSDGKILAAVSRRQGERVLIDCGYTRYFYAKNKGRNFITETAGTLRYAENVAAFLMGKGNDLAGDCAKWTARIELLKKNSKTATDELLLAFRSTDVEDRWAAVTTARLRQSDQPYAYIPLLKDPNPEVRKEAHLALVELADGEDLGPELDANEAECIEVIARWTAWWDLRTIRERYEKIPAQQVAQGFQSEDLAERRGAVQAALDRQLDLPRELIPLLSDSDEQVRQTAQAALTLLAEQDFGPPPAADAATRAAAIARWEQWAKRRGALHEALRGTLATLSKQLRSTDTDLRWAALQAVVTREMDVTPEEFIRLLADPVDDIVQLARSGLIRLAKEDHGPEPGAGADVRETAIERWKAWNSDRLEEDASRKLRLARKLWDRGRKETTRPRLQEIVKDYPTTQAAREAARLLEE